MSRVCLSTPASAGVNSCRAGSVTRHVVISSRDPKSTTFVDASSDSVINQAESQHTRTSSQTRVQIPKNTQLPARNLCLDINPSSSETLAKIARKRLYRIGLNYFNKKPWKGLEFLIKNRFIGHSVFEIATFLHTRRGLSRQMIGELLGDKRSDQILKVYSRILDLRNLSIDEALRIFNSYFLLTGESERILRMVEHFSASYWSQNEQWLVESNQIADLDAVLLLAYSILMLNTDLNSGKIKPSSRMKLKDFIKNLRGLNKGRDFDSKFLTGIYQRINESEFTVRDDHSTQVRAIAESFIPEAALAAPPHRRLVCLCKMQECEFNVSQKATANLPHSHKETSNIDNNNSEMTMRANLFSASSSTIPCCESSDKSSKSTTPNASMGYIQAHRQLRHVFLFNDFIIVCREHKSTAENDDKTKPPTNNSFSTKRKTNAILSSTSSSSSSTSSSSKKLSSSSSLLTSNKNFGKSDQFKTNYSSNSLFRPLACINANMALSSNFTDTHLVDEKKKKKSPDLSCFYDLPDMDKQFKIIHSSSLVGIKAQLLYKNDVVFAVQLCQQHNQNQPMFTLRAVLPTDFAHFLEDLRECILETNQMESMHIQGELN